MGFLSDMVARKSSATSTLDLFREIYGGRLSKAGEPINWKTALQVSTVLACARVIGTGLAQVPLKLFRETPDGQKNAARDHPLYRLLHRRPNPWQTSYEYRETIGLHLVLCNRHYSFINRGPGGRILELIPLEPQQVRTERTADGVVTYHVAGIDGTTRPFPAGSIWHIRRLSWNGWEGMEAVQLAREAIGLAIATESQHAAMHRNGVSPTGTYSVEGNLNADQYKALREHIATYNAGENKGLPMILDRSAKWLSQAMSGVDAQHLETRRFQVEEVCRSLGVMPIMVFSSDKAATYASVEQMLLAHVVHTLSPLYELVEQSIDVNLLTERDDAAGVYAKFAVQALLRGAMKDRGEFYARALGAGGAPAWLTQDEIRELEERNPMGGSASRLPVPTNVAPTTPPDKEPDVDPDDTPAKDKEGTDT